MTQVEDDVERVAEARRRRPSMFVVLACAASLLIVVPLAGFVWFAIKAADVADRTTVFLEAWQARDYELVQDLLDQDCFQTAAGLRALLGDSAITDFHVDRRSYSFATVTRGSISFDGINVQNFEFNFEGGQICGSELWDPPGAVVPNLSGASCQE